MPGNRDVSRESAGRVAERVNEDEEKLSRPECRRCLSKRVLFLEKRREEDNYVLRCLECGFLFSPPRPPTPKARHTATEPGSAGGEP